MIDIDFCKACLFVVHFGHRTCYFIGKVDYWFWVRQVVLEPIKPHVLTIFNRVNTHFWITYSVQILGLKLNN